MHHASHLRHNIKIQNKSATNRRARGPHPSHAVCGWVRGRLRGLDEPGGGPERVHHGAFLRDLANVPMCVWIQYRRDGTVIINQTINHTLFPKHKNRLPRAAPPARGKRAHASTSSPPTLPTTGTAPRSRTTSRMGPVRFCVALRCLINRWVDWWIKRWTDVRKCIRKSIHINLTTHL